jgi:hypothetical protein
MSTATVSKRKRAAGEAAFRLEYLLPRSRPFGEQSLGQRFLWFFPFKKEHSFCPTTGEFVQLVNPGGGA